MKKIVTSICMVALVALAFTSCKKNETSQAVAFNYSTEQLVNDEGSYEKVYLDDNYKVQFEPGDLVTVFNITDATGTTSNSVLYEVNNNNLLEPYMSPSIINPTTAGHYYTFYPGNNVVSVANLGNENRATFRLDATQEGRVDSLGQPMIPYSALYMAAKDETHQTFTQTHFHFKNICGVLSPRFYSADGKKIKSIAVTDNAMHLTGDVTLKIHEVDPDRMTTLFRNYQETPAYTELLNNYKTQLGWSVANAGSTVVVDYSNVPGGGVQLGQTADDATRFFIVLRPLALLHGCHIVVTTIDDQNVEDTFELHSTIDNRIKPNNIKNMVAVCVD